MFSNVLPKVVYDVGPGGSVITAGRGVNAFNREQLENVMQKLQNQFYAPKTQAEINYRNAITTGQNIDNQFAPDRNRLANQHAGLVNQFYAPNILSEIGLRNATAASTRAEIPFIPQKYENQTRNSLTSQGLLNARQSNSFREWTKTPEGQAILASPEGKQIAGAIFQNMQNQAASLGGNNALNMSMQQQQDPGNNPLNTMQLNDNDAFINKIQSHAFDNSPSWNTLPAETKNGLIAQGMGMGVDPAQMRKYISQGMTIPEIAAKEGLDPNNVPQARYFPTSATKTRTQLVEQVGAEMDYLSSSTTPLISKYADTFAGFSPKRISDMLSNDPQAQDRFGEYVGALSVQTGLANGRVALEGGRSGLEVMRMVKDSALKGIDQHSPIKMNKRTYEKAQETIDRILRKGAKIRTMTGMSPLSDRNQSTNSDLSSMSDDELMRIASGGE